MQNFSSSCQRFFIIKETPHPNVFGLQILHLHLMGESLVFTQAY